MPEIITTIAYARAILIFIAVALIVAREAITIWRLLEPSPVIFVERGTPITNLGGVSSHYSFMGSDGFSCTTDYNSAWSSTRSASKINDDISSSRVPDLYYRGRDGSFVSVTQSSSSIVYYS
ncbi:hypothetical protein F4677DRAFT_248510 [Hypoxylon crocopeplum]|nr:hypothetical protein F4677DRAFT_248510 [Hypoxylon crocopeplum]